MRQTQRHGVLDGSREPILAPLGRAPTSLSAAANEVARKGAGLRLGVAWLFMLFQPILRSILRCPAQSGAGESVGLQHFRFSACALETAILDRMRERSVIEVLCDTAHWTGWGRHFGPLSGSDAKIDQPTALDRHTIHRVFMLS